MKIFKELLLFTSMMMFGLAMNGQDKYYIPLINPNNTWSIFADGSAGGLQVYSYYLKTDTTIVVINGKDYHKLMQTYDTLGVEDTWTLAGYISEDTISMQCYFISPEMEEGLIYDFSANVGDTLHLWNSLHSNPPGDVVIVEKDSVIIGGQYRNRLTVLWLNPWFDKRWEETWIEGLGSLDGLTFSNYILIGINYALLCFYENDELVFFNDFYDDCYFPYFTEIEETTQSHQLTCFPNPAKDWTAFEYTLPGSKTDGIIKITDVTGNIVQTFTVTGEQGTKIWDTRKIKPGIYFYEFVVNGYSNTGKIIVNN